MKKITFNLSKLLLIIVLGLFLITIISTSNNIHAIWDNKSLVNVTNDDGSVVYYNKSKEPVMRATDYNFPLQSLRATWVSQFVGSIPLYSTEAAWKSDVKKMLDRVEEYGLNCIVYHVRTHNNACYKTDLAPRATFMEKADFDTFDPIEYLITECHKRAIEFHAWLNPYRISDSYCAEGYPKENPASDPANILSVGSNKILNPALPNVQDFLVKVCVELAENYDIDAIHFDDYFYIDGVDDTETRKKLNTNNLSVGDFRRQAVDQFIEKLSKSIKDYNKKNHKAVQIGISPPGGYRNQSSSSYPSKPTYNTDGSLKSPLGSNTSCFTSYDDYLYADTLKWVNNEWIDYMMPQMYWSISHTGASYADLTEWWSWAVRNRKVNLYTGIGYYMAAGSGSSASYWQKNINEIRDQILLAQTRPEIGGVCFYSYNYLNNTNKTIKTGMDLLKNNYYKTKIPCDVKKSYAGVYEKKDVTNVKLVSNEITWNKVDDVRGYIIFEVKPNEELNLKNDLQVAYYGTDTKFTIKDLNNTYYISTVNQANEISTPKIISKFEKSPTKLIEYINNVPARTDKNYKVYIESIYDIYNSLTNAEKELVTNKDKLLNIIELDNAYIDLSDKINNYVNIKLYSDETQNLINKKIKESLESASSATSVQEINNIYEAYKKEIDTYKLAEEELKELRSLGLGIIYMGLETGNKELLSKFCKGQPIEEVISAGKKVKQSKIKLSVTAISGLGGTEKWHEHAIDTGKALSMMKPDYVGLLTLRIFSNTPLYTWVQNKEITMMTPLQLAAETKLLLENTDSEGTVFRSNHASNYLVLKGTLNKDKARLIAQLDEALKGKVPFRKKVELGF